MGETEAERTDGETVEIPWMDEPLPVGEAVEVVAQAFNEEADDAEALEDRIEQLEGRIDEMEGQVDEVESRAESETDDSESDSSDLTERVETLERCVDVSNDGTTVTCPSCGSDEQVLKSGVAAAVLVRKEALSDNNVEALNEESHLCLSCRTAFTPCEVGGDDDREALR